ncbi:MAG: dephospho-CoA kinase, partial [Firmicutes bacterium]|nr:dephospho-CoA kinase [Bacillota bacterium]
QTQLQRLMERDRLSEARARQRLAAQLPLHEKVRQADAVIDNGGSLSSTRSQVEKLWQRVGT